MNFKLFFSLFTVVVGLYTNAQVSVNIVEITKDMKSSSSTSNTEIQITNQTGQKLAFNYSTNKQNWTNGVVVPNQKAIEVFLSNKIQFYYLELCTSSTETKKDCDIFQLSPGNRYFFKYNYETEKFVIKKYR